MSKEVNELLDKLGELEEAPLIWINKKVFDTSKEIERLKQELQDTKEHLGEYLYEQEEENKKLKNKYNITRDNFYALAKRINKAIEYIEENCYDYDYETYSNLTTDEVIELLNILKGEDKE